MSAQPAGGNAPASLTPQPTNPNADLRAALANTARLLLDDALPISTLERLKLTRELATIRDALSKNPATLQRLQLARQLAAIRAKLGAAKAPAPNPAPPPPEPPIDPAEEVAAGRLERTSTSGFYDYDPNRKPAQRRAENTAAIALLRQIDAGQIDPAKLTPEQKATLAKYSGTGGNLVGADGKKGSAYEYYTPKPIAEGMWSLLRELGFAGGRVLDPSAGVGIFGATAPVNAAVDAVELNETSGRVNALVNDGPGYKTTVAPFEQVASATPDEVYDAVITNVPFGGVEDRGGNQLKDTKYRNEPLQNYFILRSLEKLRPGGLAAFITPPRCVSGKGGKEEDLRRAVSYMAEFVGAYRLPNKVFGTAAADTITDVIIFRKYNRTMLDKIAELREQNPGLLAEANVIWDEFISGQYFLGEGRRFILGTMAKAKGQFGEKDVLNSDLSMSEIARLMRKFPDSRIRWDLLEAAETQPIVYAEGDTLMHAGQTLQMQDGRWVVLKSAGDEQAAAERAELLAKCSTPLGAVNAGVGYGAARALAQAMIDSGQALDVPDWLRGLLGALERMPVDGRDRAFDCAKVGLAIDQAQIERGDEPGFNYLEGYPQLSEAMIRVAADAKNAPAVLPTGAKAAIKKVGVHYSKAGGYSAVWRGDVAEQADNRGTAEKFEAEKYAAGADGFVGIDVARAVHGESFDPMADDDWCLSGDGTRVAKADDYYVGNYADFLLRINAEIAAATDESVRGKLMRQRDNAQARLLRADPSRMTFTLFSPFITLEERAEFLRRFVDPRFEVQFDDKTGDPVIAFAIGTPKTVREKLLKRLGYYVSGTNLTLGGAEVGDEKKALEELRRMAQTAEAQLNAWAHANPVIMGRLNDVANDPARLYFRQVEDDSPLTIPGLNPNWKPSPYQCAWIRKMGREFGGINGDGVGLGKTSQGLIAAQHALNIGVNRKTMFVVPNSVLSNWRKEAGRVYGDTDDCLYVGLREKKGGGFKTDTAAYDADLTRVLENRHRKIFCTYEAFQRLRLRESTVEAYDAYLASVDKSYAASELKKADEKGKSRRAQIIELLTSDSAKSLAAPFFEDMGIDSIVIDEAHLLKNSRETVEFKGGKFLSLASASARGLDAQAKAWFIRNGRRRRDGVVLLTATPITNSPLEIYSMLSLAVGDAKLQDMMLGVKGADEFMDMMCAMENQDEETLDGKIKPYDVFVGLNNVSVLRNAIAATATMRTAEQVGEQIVVPTADEKTTPIHLPEPIVDRLRLYKEAFRFAIDTLSNKKDPGGSQEAYEEVAAFFGEPMNLIGHPFNLIRKMTALITDPELDQRATFWVIPAGMADRAAAVVATWNKKPPVEERGLPGPHTEKAAVVGTKTKKVDGVEVDLLRCEVRAKVVGDRLILDTLDAETIADFEKAADKAGLDLDVTVPPKLAAMVANYQHEEANPRGRVEGMPSGRVRQLVFCDLLSLHSKIKRLISKRCGVIASAIAIITGKVNGKPEEILAVQDGFNAEGEDNKYRCVIANEKAEVGINLQKGTQAIHHLSIGWTPDALTQRNGRGVRQGNETERVTVYHYDADGTFDTYKRMLVGKKSDWIESVMDPEGGDRINVGGNLTAQQMEELINSIGNADAMGRIQERAAAAEKLARENSVRGKQTVHVKTIWSQAAFVRKYQNASAWVADRIAAYYVLGQQVKDFEFKLSNPKLAASTALKLEGRLAEFRSKRDGLKKMIEEAATITLKANKLPESIDGLIRSAHEYARKNDDRAELIIKKITDEYSPYEVVVADDSALGMEWRSEVDMAQAMLDESRKDFARLGAQEGGYSEQVLGKVETGRSFLLDGKLGCTGAFMENADGLWVVRRNTNGFIAMRLQPDGTTDAKAASDIMRDAKLALPGSPGYSDMLTKAAAIEDAFAASLGDRGLDADKLYKLFSTEVPEVAQRRAQRIPVRYPARYSNRYILPAPYFPQVLETAVPDGAPLSALIVKKQAEVVTSCGGDEFVADSAVAVKETNHKWSFPWEQVRDLARANGIKVTPADFEHIGDAHRSDLGAALMRPESYGTYEQAFASAISPDDLKAKARQWLLEDAFPDYALELDDRFNEDDPYRMLYTANSSVAMAYGRRKSELEYEERKRAQAAAAAAAAAGLLAGGGTPPPPPPPEPDPVPDNEGDDDPMRMVGISGDTRKWKDSIKSMAYTVGGKPVWDKDALRWNVPYAAWLRLIQAYPAAENELQVVDASGKTSYGRRRGR